MTRRKKSGPGGPQRQENRQQRLLQRKQELNEKLQDMKMQKACEGIEAMGLDDSDDDGGGIALNPSDTSTLGDPLSTREERTYFQPPITSLDLTNHIWKLPETPVDIGPKQLKQNGFGHPIPYQYHRNCQMIAKHWSCQPINCVPGDLKIRTPYSLAMLTQMRRLANSTKQNYNYAVSLLMKAWVERVKHFEAPSEHIQESEFVETSISIKNKACERVIYENVYGLMICDVENTIEELEAQRRAESGPKRMPKATRRAAVAGTKAAITGAEAAVAAVQAEKAKIVTQRRREDKKTRKFREEQKRTRPAAAYDLPDTESGGVSLAPPNSPVATNNQFGPLLHHTMSIRSKPVPKYPETEAMPELSHSDKENYKHMAMLMDKMGMDSSEPSRKRRLHRLAAGGLSRLAASGPLPSERLDLSNISPLPAPGSGIDAEELARLGQQALPD